MGKFIGKKEQEANYIKPQTELPPEVRGRKKEVRKVINNDEKNSKTKLRS